MWYLTIFHPLFVHLWLQIPMHLSIKRRRLTLQRKVDNQTLLRQLMTIFWFKRSEQSVLTSPSTAKRTSFQCKIPPSASPIRAIYDACHGVLPRTVSNAGTKNKVHEEERTWKAVKEQMIKGIIAMASPSDPDTRKRRSRDKKSGKDDAMLKTVEHSPADLEKSTSVSKTCGRMKGLDPTVTGN